MASPLLLHRFQGSFIGVGLGAQIGSDSTDWADRLRPCCQWLLNPQPTAAPQLKIQGIEALPLWLYAHENWYHRQQWLQMLDLPPASIPHQWVLGETLALVLKNHPNDGTLLTALLDRWQAHAQRGAPAVDPAWQSSLRELAAQLPGSLAQLGPWLKDQPLDHQPLLGALYLLITLCGSPATAYARARQLPHPDSLTFTGALLGAHLGAPGLPWRAQGYQDLSDQARDLYQDWAGFTPQATQNPSPPLLNP
jgi:hypothetical protein